MFNSWLDNVKERVGLPNTPTCGDNTYLELAVIVSRTRVGQAAAEVEVVRSHLVDCPGDVHANNV